jgi:ABC-type polysaccharide/polyol phosphate export permease
MGGQLDLEGKASFVRDMDFDVLLLILLSILLSLLSIFLSLLFIFLFIVLVQVQPLAEAIPHFIFRLAIVADGGSPW